MKERMNQRVEYYIKKLQNKAEYSDILNRSGAESADEQIYAVAFIPMLMEYVKWVLTEASKSGKKRLYFLARDGYQMYVMAKSLVAKLGMDIDCRYLNVSRYAIRIPQYHLLGEGCLEYICSGGIDVTFEKVMKRAGLTDEEAMEVAKLCGRDESYKDIINYGEVLKLREVLGKIPEFMTYIDAHSRDAYANAISYLKQEGLMDDVSYGLVDSGWVGTLQKSIEHLVQTVNPKVSVTGYYFGMYELPKGMSSDKYNAFYFSPKSGIKKKVYFSNCLYEAVFTSPEGMTIGYEEKEGKYVPVYDLVSNPNEVRINRYIEMIRRFMETYVKDEFAYNEAASKKLVRQITYRLMGNPSMEEAKLFGGFLFCDDVLEKSMQKVAVELTDEEVKNLRFVNKLLIMKGKKTGVIRDSAWIEGTIVRNGNKVRGNLWHARMYKYIVYIRKRLQQGVF